MAIPFSLLSLRFPTGKTKKIKISATQTHNELVNITKRNRLTDTENKAVVTSGEKEVGGATQEQGIKGHKLLGFK